jgi:hypothetical protein
MRYAWQCVGACLVLLLLADCGAPPPRAGAMPAVLPALPQDGKRPDASYDWRGLIVMPFGTLLAASPVALHEVLLFHDAEHAAEADPRDCYTIDGPPPRFVDRRPDEYLLCFAHDRLNRIDASVRMAADAAAETFARACSLWAGESAPRPASGATCRGRDGEIAFSAHLGDTPGDPTALLTLTLSAAADGEIGGGPSGP